MARTRKFPLPDGRVVDASVVGFHADTENFNEYQLDDGTAIKLKAVVTEVLRLDGEYDPLGNPAYVVQTGNVVAVDSPDELRRERGTNQ